MKKHLLTVLLIAAFAITLLPSVPANDYEAPYAFELQFTDVSDNDTFYEAVVWAVQESVTSGTSDTAFSPELTCTRGQVVTFLWRAKGFPEPKSYDNPFSDVAPGSYYETAVLWAVENAVTAGTSEETFSQDDTCTWAHILTFLWRANGKPQPLQGGITVDWEHSWYKSAVAWADSTGILGVDREDFDPERPCSRGTTVTWLFHDAVKTVSTADELANAIWPGRIVYLEAGSYDLTAWAEAAVSEDRSPEGGYVRIGLAADGYEFQIHGVSLLRLRSAPGAEGKVKLIAQPRYAEVMSFADCDILELTGLTLGHTETGRGEGGVLRFEGCESVYLEHMDLYGCGTYGIETRDVGRLTVLDSVIHDCSYGMMQLYSTVYAEFDGCTFRDCQEYVMLTVNGTAAFFNDCVFKDNTWGEYGAFLSCSDDDQTIVMFSRCALEEKALQELAAMSSSGKHVSGDSI